MGKRKEENMGERKKSSRFRLHFACLSQYRNTLKEMETQLPSFNTSIMGVPTKRLPD